MAKKELHLDGLIEHAHKHGSVLSFDCETTGKNAFTCKPLLYTLSAGHGAHIRSLALKPTELVHAMLNAIFTDPTLKIVMHNTSYDCKIVHRFICPFREISATVIDTIVLAWLCDNRGAPKFGKRFSLKSLSMKYLKHQMRTLEDVFVTGTLAMARQQLEKRATKLTKNWQKLAKRHDSRKRRALGRDHKLALELLKEDKTLTAEEKRTYREELATAKATFTYNYERSLAGVKRLLTSWKQRHAKLNVAIEKQFIEYALDDAAVTLRLFWLFRKKLTQLNLTGWARVELDVRMFATDMELNGVKLDWQSLSTLNESFAPELVRIENLCYSLAGAAAKQEQLKFNIQSPREVSAVLHNLVGAFPTGIVQLEETKDSVKNREANPQAAPWFKTGKQVLKYTNHPLAKAILDYREILKLQTTYTKKLSNVRGRLHAFFRSSGTDTGRFACVHGSTLLQTSCGTFRIDSLPLTEYPDMTILTHKGRQKKILRRFLKGKDLMYAVTTAAGQRIICTGKHRFLTETGWQALSDLTIGSGIYTTADTPPESRTELPNDCPGRTELHSPVPGRTANTCAGQRPLRSTAPRLEFVERILEVEVCHGTAPKAQCESCPCGNGEHPGCPAASSAVGQGGANQALHYGNTADQDSPAFSGERVFGSAQHRALQTRQLTQAGSKQSPAERIHGSRPTDARHLGTHGSGANGCGQAVLPRGRTVLREAVRATCTTTHVLATCENLLGTLRSLPTGEELTEEPRLLASECCRDGVIAGNAGPANTASAPGYALWLHRRLLLPAMENHRGGRRLVAQVQGHLEQGQTGECGVMPGWLPGRACFGGACPTKPAFDREAYRLDRIAMVVPVGKHDVWDIEVEDDHSYVAHGFLNHNSSGPNLQNIPSRTKTGKKIRDAFIADTDHVLIVADLSQIELRVGATICNERTMLDVFNQYTDRADGTKDYTIGDIHKTTQVGLSELCPFEVMREHAKVANFALLYGQSAQSFALLYMLDLRIAESLREGFFAKYSAILSMLIHLGELWRKYKFRSWRIPFSGRLRHWNRFDYVFDPETGEEEKVDTYVSKGNILNTLVQGSAADVFKIALRAFWRWVVRHKDFSWGVRPLMQVHDEVVIEVHKSIAVIVAKLLKYCMEYAWFDTPCPILADVHIVNRWSEGKNGKRDKLDEHGKPVIGPDGKTVQEAVLPEMNEQLKYLTPDDLEMCRTYIPEFPSIALHTEYAVHRDELKDILTA